MQFPSYQFGIKLCDSIQGQLFIPKKDNIMSRVIYNSTYAYIHSSNKALLKYPQMEKLTFYERRMFTFIVANLILGPMTWN